MGDSTWVNQFFQPICIYVVVAGLVTMLDASKSANNLVCDHYDRAPASTKVFHQNSPLTDDLQSDSQASSGIVERAGSSSPEEKTAGEAVVNAAVADSATVPDKDQQKLANDDATVMQQSGTYNKLLTSSNDHTKLASSTIPVPQANYDVLFDQVLSAQTKGDQSEVDESIARIDALAKPQPGDRSAATKLNKAGLWELKNKNFVEAAKFFGEAVQTDPSDARFLSNLGFAEMNAGDLSTAERHLHASISLAPRRSVVWGDLGLVLAKKGDQERSVGCFLVGYKVSEGKTLAYLQSLEGDEDPSVRSAGSIALTKVQSQLNRQ
jgi:Flp pilus assembly protein TadD